ncbi:hypothetical protein FHT86_004300 [Rhizobium sp. BK313]|nr:hypothetical protein [Rhizobium sp. BK313]
MFARSEKTVRPLPCLRLFDTVEQDEIRYIEG